MNTQEETAFEQSIYHYFLFKANQASSAQEKSVQSPRNLTAAAGPTTPSVTETATNADTEDDGAKKPVAKPSGQDSSKKSAFESTVEKDGAGTVAKTASKNSGDRAKQSSDSASHGKESTTTTGLGRLVNNPSQQSTATMSAKYHRLAAAMKKDFPQYDVRLSTNAAWLAPDGPMRYTHFPQVHTEVGFLRQRVFILEQQVQQQAAQMQNMRQALQKQDHPPPVSPKRGRPPDLDTTGLTPAAKKIMTDANFYANKHLAGRPDVPDDVKELVKQVKKDARNERRTMKQKITRLEKKVSESSAKLTKMAHEQLKNLPPPPHVVAAAASAKEATPTKPKLTPPKPKPAPVAPPPSFESRFKELQDFKLANNTTRVPGRIPGLGRWVSDIRKCYRICKERPELLQPKKYGSAADLTVERIKRLEEIGFEFDVYPKVVSWEDRFAQVVAYKEKHGNTFVPRNWKENPSLGEWVHMQRKLYRQGASVIQGGRTDKLNSIGFAWSGNAPKKASWEERIDECREYRRKHGNLNVPPPPKPKKEGEEETEENITPEERSFLSWAHRQRLQYVQLQEGKKTSLDNKRAKQLDDLGFNWTVESSIGTRRGSNLGKAMNQEIYNDQVAKLKRVKDLYGDCNDLKDIEKVCPGDKKLYYWMKTQRKQYKSWKKGEWSSLTTERRLMLETIGFNFEPRKHYAPYGSKKRGTSEEEAGEAAMQAAVEAAAELADDEEDEDDNPYASTMRDYEYIQGGGVRI
jgi:hypothetical protein